jgi:serine/threonine protein phosphatase 1
MKYYVIADPHGFYDEMIKALRSAGYFDEKGEKRLVVVGDLLDRGSQAQKIVEFMMGEDLAGRLIYVVGNHEDLMIDALQSIAKGDIFMVANPVSHHYRNGTWDTILQLSGMNEKDAVEHPINLVRRVLDHDFYKTLLYRAVDYFETANYVFAHGYIPSITDGFRPVISAEYDHNWRDATPQQWRTARWYNGMEMNYFHNVRIPDKTIVCGHWHTSYGHAHIEEKGSEYGSDADFTPFYGDGIIALDACTKVSGIVNCIVLED